jgi:hypothetical protein
MVGWLVGYVAWRHSALWQNKKWPPVKTILAVASPSSFHLYPLFIFACQFCLSESMDIHVLQVKRTVDFFF